VADGKLLMAVRCLLEEILDQHLKVSQNLPTSAEADSSWKKDVAERSKVAERLIMKEWPSLLARGCEAEESTRLFARCPEGKHMQLATAVVEGALQCSVVSGAPQPVGEVARRALAWLSSPPEGREVFFASLVQLWAKVIAREVDAPAFEAGIKLLGTPELPSRMSAKLVQALIAAKPRVPVLREALHWLSTVCPEDAVSLWPSLLSCVDIPEVVDVKALLDLCEGHGLEPPELPALVARTLPHEALGLLAASSIPEARVAALQVLQAKLCGPSEMEVVYLLCDDSSEVVRVAAQHLKTSITGEPSGQPVLTASDSFGRRGKGKGKAKGKR